MIASRVSMCVAQLATAAVLAACTEPAKPQLVHVDRMRQPWVELQMPGVLCYINVHWPNPAETRQLMGIFAAPRHSPPTGAQVLMIDLISRDLVVSVPREPDGSCDRDDAVTRAVSVSARLELSEASRITEEMWTEARAGRSGLICNLRFTVDLNIDDAERALLHVYERQNGGGMLRNAIEGNEISLELYRNCGLETGELNEQYRALIEASGS